ncbi:MAG: DUF1003 domain-containing protein [Candidatus Binataceae bacterium]
MIPASTLAEQWEARRIRHGHDHPPVRNTNVVHDRKLSFGDRLADRFTLLVGSWSFLIVQSILLVIWITANVIGYLGHWDPYPFILLNLVLSFQAAYTAPVIMMSQNRQAAKDRIAAEQDYEVNLTAEEELKQVMRHLEQQDELIIDALRTIERQHQELLSRTARVLDISQTTDRHGSTS